MRWRQPVAGPTRSSSAWSDRSPVTPAEPTSDQPLLGLPFAVKDNIDVPGLADHRRLPRLHHPGHAATRMRSSCWSRPARCRSARPTWTSSRPAWSAPGRRTAPATASTPPSTSAAAAARAARSRWPRASSRSRWAPTRPAAAGCRPRSTAWSGSSPPAAWSARAACSRRARPWTASRSSLRTVSMARSVLRGRRQLRSRGPLVPRSRQSAAGRHRPRDAGDRRAGRQHRPRRRDAGWPGSGRWPGSPTGSASCRSTSRRCSRRRHCCTTPRSSPSDWPRSVICSSRTVHTSTRPSGGSCWAPGTCAADRLFAAQHRLAELARATEQATAGVDAVLLPTTPLHPTLRRGRRRSGRRSTPGSGPTPTW